MSVWLTGATVFPRVEKSKELLRADRLRAVLPSFEASICRIQITFLQEVCLWLEGFCGQNEVVRYNWVFVQNQDMGRVSVGNFSDKEIGRRILEWVWLL